jgi:hypothetical protein
MAACSFPSLDTRQEIYTLLLSNVKGTVALCEGEIRINDCRSHAGRQSEQPGSYPETGLEEINGDLLEEDFWTASLQIVLDVTSGLAVICPESGTAYVVSANAYRQLNPKLCSS